jgi:hypothetical protein
VELTPAAQRDLWPYYEPLARLSMELYARYSDEQLALVLDFFKAAAELFDRRLEEMRPGAEDGEQGRPPSESDEPPG